MAVEFSTPASAVGIAAAMGLPPSLTYKLPVVLPVTIVATSSAKITGNTNENIAAYVNVPGGVLGANGSLELVSLMDSASVAGTAITGSIRIITGTVAGTASGGTRMVNANYANAGVRFRSSHEIYNLGATNAQGILPASLGGFTTSSGANADAAIDTTAAFTVSLNLALVTGTDSVWVRALRAVAWPS